MDLIENENDQQTDNQVKPVELTYNMKGFIKQGAWKKGGGVRFL